MGIDALAQPYNLEQGYAIHKTKWVTSLVIRMEDLNNSLIPALSNFLAMDLKDLPIKRANVGAKKWYSDALEHIKTTYRVPEGPARAVFDTPYFNHFYAHETDRYLKRWT